MRTQLSPMIAKPFSLPRNDCRGLHNDQGKAQAFYDKVLAPLGLKRIMDMEQGSENLDVSHEHG